MSASTTYRRGGSRTGRRRGESLMEVMTALSIFTVAMLGLGTQWVAARQQMNIVREQQTLARIAEMCAEEVRSAGAFYLPNTGNSPRVRYYDARGQVVASSAADGYFSRTWITYLKNPNSFKDGTGGTTGSSSLREIEVAVYRTGDSKPILESASYVAPTGLGSPL